MPITKQRPNAVSAWRMEANRMPDSPNESPQSRMWSGLFLAALFAYAAFFSIARNEILGRRSSSTVSPMIGLAVGAVQAGIVVYFLFTAWGAYQNLRAARDKKVSPEI
jgi:hypothetical protein